MHETFGAIRSQNFIYIICSERSHYSGQSTNCGCHCQGPGPELVLPLLRPCDTFSSPVMMCIYISTFMQMPIPMRSDNNTYPFHREWEREKERESIALNSYSVPQNCNKIFWLIHFALNFTSVSCECWSPFAHIHTIIYMDGSAMRFTVFAIWMNAVTDTPVIYIGRDMLTQTYK